MLHTEGMTCEFSVNGDPCGQPAVVVRRLEREAPYGLCALHAIEDTDILELPPDALADEAL
jgi:hypothetical protein